jgi:hypothetical protein
MNHTIEPAREGDDLFELTVCPDCDYSLANLPVEGTCPECGRTYDQSFLVLSGHGRGRLDTTWRSALWPLISVAMFGGMAWANRFRSLSPVMIALLAFLGLTVALHAYARLFSARERGAQVWLSPQGVGQRKSSPEARWAEIASGYVFYALVLLGMVVWIIRPGAGGGAVAAYACAALVIVAFAKGRVWRWHRRELDDRPVIYPWASIEQMEIDELLSGRHRFILRVGGPGGKVGIAVVDIELFLDEQETLKLRNLIQQWSGGRLSCTVNNRPSDKE